MTAPESIVEALDTFLSSRKVDELLTPELRSAIEVDIGLEAVLDRSVRRGRSVVLAGSAGSGKTHLLNRLLTGAADLEVSHDALASDADLVIAADATGRLASLPGMVDDCARASVPWVVAINEGPLLQLARDNPDSPFASAREALHRAQEARIDTGDDDGPVVIDVGAFDPTAAGVVSRILRLDAIEAIIEQRRRCDCESGDVCPRVQAYRQLASETVRDRFDGIMRMTGSTGQPPTFSQVWDFIADLVTQGDCDADPPTSPWFWRVFEGGSELSAGIRRFIDPDLIAAPDLEMYLWLGDWNQVDHRVAENVDFVSLPGRQFDPDQYRWLKIQALFLHSSDGGTRAFETHFESHLLEAVHAGELSPIVHAVNRYATYAALPVKSSELDLWIDVGVEKRTRRTQSQISLGTVGLGMLRVRTSRVVADFADDDLEIPPGGRRYLVFSSGGNEASLELTPDFLSLIGIGRSSRSADRDHTDAEWHLHRFYFDVADLLGENERVKIMQIDFETMTAAVSAYGLDPASRLIEVLEAAS